MMNFDALKHSFLSGVLSSESVTSENFDGSDFNSMEKKSEL